MLPPSVSQIENSLEEPNSTVSHVIIGSRFQKEEVTQFPNTPYRKKSKDINYADFIFFHIIMEVIAIFSLFNVSLSVFSNLESDLCYGCDLK